MGTEARLTCRSGSHSPIFQKLLGIPNVKAEDQQAVTQALRWYQEGLDFANAMPFASSAKADRFATFDKDFVKKASKLGSIETLQALTLTPVDQLY